MVPMLIAEFTRFRAWALGLALAHAAAWALLATVQPILTPDPHRNAFLLLLTLAVGLLLGFVQMGLHRRLNAWTYLIHRPLDPTRIYAALSGAALALLACAVLLPWWTVLLALDTVGGAVVEMRHYLQGLYLLAVAYSAYLTASFIVLSPSKGAFLTLILVGFLVGHPPSTFDHAPGAPPVVYLVAVVVVLWLLFLNVTAFLPDPSRLPRSAAVIFLTALPMQLALLTVVHLALFAPYAASKELLSRPPPDGSYDAFVLLERRERVQRLLEGLECPGIESLRSQVRLGQVNAISVRPRPAPHRGVLPVHEGSTTLVDRRQDGESHWMFSHREMLFRGTEGSTGRALGWLGPRGFHGVDDELLRADRFEVVPVIFGGGVLRLPQRLLHVDFEDRTIGVKHRLAGDETYVGGFWRNDDYLSIATGERLYLFDRRAFAEAAGPVEPVHIVPHPRAVRFLSGVLTVRLVDGYLLLYSNDYLYGGGRPGAILLRTRLDGTRETLLEHEFRIHDAPAFYRFESLTASPILHTLRERWIWGAIEPGERRHRRISLAEAGLPRSLWLTLALIGLASGVVTWLLSRRSSLPGATRWVWTIWNALVGLPGLISFLLLTGRSRSTSAPHASTADA